MKKLLFVLLSILSMHLMANEPEGFPIIADMMHTELYDNTRFNDLKKAGFNACFCRCKTNEVVINALEAAKPYGIKLIIFSHPIMRFPEKIVPFIKEHPSMWQYLLADEPKMDRLMELQQIQQRISRYDPNAECYINLLPNTGKAMLKNIGVESYPQYLQAYSNRVQQPQISYDFYPIHGKVVRDDIWYPILEDIRKESLRTGRPFWAFIMGVPHHIYPQPTIEHLRLQCYANLAYGAQGIQYFGYSTPEPTEQYDFRNGALLRNGKKSSTYKLISKMNAELKPVVNLFWKSKVTAIEHRKCINGSVLVSHFEKGDARYTCFVNKSADRDVTFSVRPNDYAWRVQKNMKKSAVDRIYNLSAGDILILRNR